MQREAATSTGKQKQSFKHEEPYSQTNLLPLKIFLQTFSGFASTIVDFNIEFNRLFFLCKRCNF